ncbi:hypothetical protein NQ314_004056 [Rhamnusium bicolor]|uniref:Wolframin n=1 Tax=Rhamnusium bicolor TaxID=1586634 RepID=A0AAV8ZKH0_9CUCU|nr:hypothetical protein NQ314_004056 [Rhamnusium bicolor]
MAGVVPKKSTSGRKQWTLHGGPKSSLKRLRNQLASDGCPESQVVLAKQLLDEQCEFESERKENARLGVYWLIKASEQGNIEATNLLKTCLETGKGITEHNYMDVKSCIYMTQDEKLARKAAREMFASLSNGGDYITSDQLQRKILAIDRGEPCSKSTETSDIDHEHFGNGELINDYEEMSESDEDTDWSQKSDISNEKLTEDHLVSAAVDYSHGQLPIVNRILCLSDPNLKSLDHIPFVHRSILHPLLAIKILYFKLIKFLGQKTIPLFFPLAKSEFQLVILMFVYAFFSSENVLYFLPMFAYYVSFIVMICTTFQMLQNQRQFLDFRLWSGLFICYSGGNLNAEEMERQYIRNNLRPYGHFFIGLLVNLMIYPIISEQWIPQSELTLIAFLLTFMTLLGFMPKSRSKTVFDTVVLFSFAINVLAKYPYETDPVVAQGWRFLELKVPTFPSYVIGNGIEFCINFKFILYACIPIIFLKIAAKHNWRGTYETLIPHCVTLSWLQICIISSQGATMFGFLRGTLALVGVVLFLPLVGLTSVILPVVALTKWIVTSNLIHAICIFLILSIIGIGICYLCAQTRYRKYTAVIQIVLMVLAFFVLINSTTREHSTEYYVQNKSSANNDVGSFPEILPPANMARRKYCLVSNKMCRIRRKSYTLEWFPSSFSEYLHCLYGENVESDLNKCSLQKYNTYTFEITLKMQSGIWGKATEVKLIISNHFKAFILKLKPTDHIWFKGVLFNNEIVGSDGVLGGLKPHVNLEELGCISCQNNMLTELKMNTQSSFNIYTGINALYLGFKFILNVLFNPIVVFK